MTMVEILYLMEFTSEPENKYAGKLTRADVDDLLEHMEAANT